ncbi:hypothetical protein [Novipirellula artificiosorum]|uniref:Competence protein A n=1 Tax=Novipirellula artificiosorum TaxID=2528016 RepID=A0A5C6DMA9_9BACT|nr:hypothetical protein [Novipirellula artificiosorum]TWU38483.1 hypothetical protein Poly41_29590 [Novipirellula artificiosorum]
MPIANVLQKLPFLDSLRGPTKRGPVLFASWDQVNVYFLVVKERKDTIGAIAWGTIEREAEKPSLEVLHRHLKQQQISASRLVLLLPRTDLEMTTVEIPPAEEGEVAALVRAEVEQLIGDSDHDLVVDYRLLDGATPSPILAPQAKEPDKDQPAESDPVTSRPHTAAAFSLEEGELNQWKEATEKIDLQLAAFTSRQTAPLAQLRTKRVFRSPLSVLIVVYEGEVELSFFRGNRLASLRTFRAGSHDVGSLTDQIQTEVQRSISLMDFVAPGERPELLVLVRSPLDASEDVQPKQDVSDESLSLCESLDANPVYLAMPVDSSSKQDDPADSRDADPVLVAAAYGYAQHQLAVDLVHPKVPPVPPNPIRRWGSIAALAAGSLGIVSYTMIADVNDLKGQVSERKLELTEAEQIAGKMQEKADETRLVQQWLGDQVDWLGQLQKLSGLFPEGQRANVRRLSANVDGTTGVFDLSIQVNDPNRVAELENRLRDANFSITSKRISEQTNNEEYPWQFEARIAFPIAPLEEREEETFLLNGESENLGMKNADSEFAKRENLAEPDSEEGTEVESSADAMVSEVSENAL